MGNPVLEKIQACPNCCFPLFYNTITTIFSSACIFLYDSFLSFTLNWHLFRKTFLTLIDTLPLLRRGHLNASPSLLCFVDCSVVSTKQPFPFHGLALNRLNIFFSPSLTLSILQLMTASHSHDSAKRIKTEWNVWVKLWSPFLPFFTNYNFYLHTDLFLSLSLLGPKLLLKPL